MVKGYNRTRGSVEWGRNQRKALFPAFPGGQTGNKDWL